MKEAESGLEEQANSLAAGKAEAGAPADGPPGRLSETLLQNKEQKKSQAWGLVVQSLLTKCKVKGPNSQLAAIVKKIWKRLQDNLWELPDKCRM